MDPKELLRFKASAGTPVNRPLIIDDAETAPWDDACDVLVVGFGLAGASAAMKAAERPDISVLVADRFTGGGASELSGGIIYAGGTHVQREAGVEDSTDNLYNYLGHETEDFIKPETLRRFCDDSPQVIRWMEKQGVVFGGPATHKKTSYPTDEFYIYYSGNETVPEAAQRATPAPRGHRAKPTFKSKAVFGGVFIMHAMKQAAARAPNVRTSWHTAARRLVLDKTGAVVGAELWSIPQGTFAAWRHRKLYAAGTNMILSLIGASKHVWQATAALEAKYAKPRLVRVRRGITLAAGGFINNRPMVETIASKYVDVAPLGTVGDDGSGIQLGVSAGGDVLKIDNVSAWRFINPPYDWMKAVMVGSDGRRLTNEEQYGARLGEALFAKSGGKGWIVVDHAVQEKAVAEINSDQIQRYQQMQLRGMLRKQIKADSLAELERKLGIPAGNLVATISGYNADIVSGTPDAEGKNAANCVPLQSGPFYAFDVSGGIRLNPVPGITLGGLRVDDDTGAVLRPDGVPIPGLHAAGRNAAGICANWYISGLSLADCIWTGWRAADGAVARN
ncbi:MAG: FAD-binding protein [Sphingomonadales bacterium]|nr:FAD-binding protein [Sphingomonadales bacterium]MBU3994025.1 FAD-binding protein [Alphaproteobacteria bacterium]